MGGMEYLEERKNRGHKLVPTIVLSAYVGVPMAVGGLHLDLDYLAPYGVVTILTKPVPIEVLLDTVREGVHVRFVARALRDATRFSCKITGIADMPDDCGGPADEEIDVTGDVQTHIFNPERVDHMQQSGVTRER